ncbi:MAG: bifunctional 2',3'-cyclic-nucleotide 2'-phosphodiesterase/3'-nucleotidase [Alphaproteobacteria bacterium]|nr:bifunctional 2',3'-cyclic-nucleotide 2'-phosphodiesterase/3'-nucleotidase [Alphaproteobacteria bacterium]
MTFSSLSRRALFRGLVAAVLAFPFASLAAETTVKLRLMETTDIHVHVMNYDYYRDQADHSFGLSKTASLIKIARGEVANSLLIDNGDLIQGNPMGDYIAREKGLKDGDIHPVYKAMNLLGYDVGNIGNHEFNYGLEFLATALKGAKFPYVNANVMSADGQKNMYTPYLILERKLKDEAGKEHPIKIGVIGFVPPQIMAWDRRHLEGKVTAKDIVETAKRFVPEMKSKGADLLIAVPHSGLGPVETAGSDENATWLLSKVPGVDAILFGHAHLLFPSEVYKSVPGIDVAKGTVNGVAAVMPGFWGNHLGLIDLTLAVDDAGKWKVTDRQSSLRAVFRMQDRQRVPAVDNDPAVVAAVKDDHDGTLGFIRKPVGKIAARLHSYFALVQDDPSIQIVTDAQKWYVENLLKATEYRKLPVLSAGAPFKAGGRSGPEFYTDIPAGPLAVKNVADLYLYPNTVQVVRVTGAQVKEWLEMSAGIFNQIDPNSAAEQALINQAFPSYNYDVIDGVTYKIDVTRPRRYDNDGKLVASDSHRIIDLAYQGRLIDPEMVFAVATNNYRASGGGKFPALDGKNVIVESPEENRTVIIEYLFDKGSIDPSADNNWSFAKPSKPVTVLFESSPAAEALLASAKGMTKLGPDANGFMRYALKLE